jgi:Arc/MetJ-type ribon-helix-helix transcriptional regulator
VEGTPVCVRLDEDLVGAVDRRVSSGTWSSRSDWLRDVIERAVAEEREPA